MSDRRSKLVRIAKVTTGVALLPVGVVMFVTPWPGLAVVMSGLALLEDDFDWAKSALGLLRCAVNCVRARMGAWRPLAWLKRNPQGG
jgi:hypothetical protein